LHSKALASILVIKTDASTLLLPNPMVPYEMAPSLAEKIKSKESSLGP